MTLDFGEVDKYYIVEKLELPLRMEKRLESLGMTTGTDVLVMNNNNQGRLIIKIRGTRLAIGRGISRNIHVRSK